MNKLSRISVWGLAAAIVTAMTLIICNPLGAEAAEAP